MSDATKTCPMCGEQILAVAKKCRYCGEYLDPQARAEARAPDAVERMLLPVGRPVSAIAAGYFGLLSFFPLVGAGCGVCGIIFGVIALKQIAGNPALSGKGRAWFGIIAGGLMTLMWGIAIVILIIGLVAESQRR